VGKFLFAITVFLFSILCAAQETPSVDLDSPEVSQEMKNDYVDSLVDDVSEDVTTEQRDVWGDLRPGRRHPLEAKKKMKRGGELVVAPVPFYNPSQGYGLALMGQYIFAPKVEHAAPSIAMLGVFGTQKKSYGGIAGYIGRLMEDRLRIISILGAMQFNSDFYGVGKETGQQNISVPLKQDMEFLAIAVTPQIWRKVYLGPSVAFSHVKNNFDLGQYSYLVPTEKLDIRTWTPGLRGEWDTRDNTFYPQSGGHAGLTALFHDQSFGDGNTYQKYMFYYNHYFGLNATNVIAMRVNTETGEGDVPFYDMAQFGQRSDLRGYQAGKYRDKVAWSTQGEYRYRFTDRWGAVYFAGIGDVIPSWSKFDLERLLWSTGAGLRFRIAENNPVDFRFDIAYGDNQWTWYFGVNQAF
jgi:hypothetical protein